MFRIVPNKSKSDGVPTPYCTMPCSGFTCQWELPATAVLLTYLYCNLLLYQSLWTKTWIEWLEYICISIFLLGVEFVVQQDQYVGGGWLTLGEGSHTVHQNIGSPPPPPRIHLVLMGSYFQIFLNQYNKDSYNLWQIVFTFNLAL